VPAEPLLDIRDLRVEFGGYRGAARVLNGVNLTVGRGEKVGLVGETGCGKSLTVRAVLGLLRPPRARVRGEIWFAGRDLLALPPGELRAIRGRRIAMIFQDPMAALNPVFTIGEQLLDVVVRNRRGRTAARDVRARAHAILKEVALPDPERIMRAYPVQLSGGMRQRVLIAMALVNEPDLIIADEPGTALDVTIQEQILLLMRSLVEAKGISVLLITHNLGVVRETTDRVYVMYAGGIVETAPTDELFRAPRHPYTQGLLASIPKLTGEGMPRGIDGMIPDYLRPPAGCRFAPRCPFAQARCHQPPPWVTVAAGHHVACVLYEDNASPPVARAAPSPLPPASHE
jgi:peptide/nickel transport system ATP-binding protein